MNHESSLFVKFYEALGKLELAEEAVAYHDVRNFGSRWYRSPMMFLDDCISEQLRSRRRR